MVVIPGLAGDQPFVAAAVEEWGVGRALPGDADADAMRAAAQRRAPTPSFQGTRSAATALAGIDGAAIAADEVETLLGAKRAETTEDQCSTGRLRRALRTWQTNFLDQRRYFANTSSAAVMRPVSGCFAQYSPSFLALATNFSVSITGGSSSLR